MVHMALLDEAQRDRRAQPAPARQASPPSVAITAGDPSRAHDRATCSACRPRAPRPAAMARPWRLGRHRRRDESAPRIRLPAGRRRGSAPDPGRAGARRHHRARPLPLYGERRDVVRLEERLGYVHKGIESLIAGADLGRAAQLAGRTSGDSTVAYALAFARAAEAPPASRRRHARIWLRALMAELERIANHIGDIGAICNDASFTLMHAHCGVLRERVLRTADACFGHRLMMDRIVPGGVANDLAARRRAIISVRCWPRSAAAFRSWPSSTTTPHRCRTARRRPGVSKPELVRQFGAGGHVGRAAGRAFDARRPPGYPPYDQLAFTVPVLERGRRQRQGLDPDSRGRAELSTDRADPRAPAGGTICVSIVPAAGAGEGMALVESVSR